MSNGLNTPAVAQDPGVQSSNKQVQDGKSSLTIHRSASLTQLPGDSDPEGALARTTSLNRSFSENVLANTPEKVTQRTLTKHSSTSTVKKRRSMRRLGSIKRQSIVGGNEPQFTISKFVIGADQSLEDVGYESPDRNEKSTPEQQRKTHSVSGSISKFARKSWASASRSPSPSPSKRRSRINGDVPSDNRNGNTGITETLAAQDATKGSPKISPDGVPRRNSILRRRSGRPLSALLSKTPDDPNTPSVPPIPKSFSTEKLPSLKHKSSTLSDAPALPKSKSFERFQNLGTETPRKKDELWSAFRNIDGEYQKFQARPGIMKTGIVRSALLPFLRSYAEHPSISSLRPEDLDRRTVILNKWWTGLLEMLNGRQGESVSGNDRPAVLEAVTALMIRPEWTLPSLAATARPSKTARASLKSRSTTSLGSTMTMSSDFLAESIYHNVRNTFTQNLLAQMAYVVDKMSMRNVPASVVTFCGKAAAYAFFYCEGIAEILVRLWATSPDMLKRVLAESDIQPGENKGSTADRICGLFPPNLHPLTFRSQRALTRYLHSRPHVPIATAYIPWHGPWISRWAGKDTDLFYVFVKFYTDLTCRFLPEQPSVEETVAAPGWIIVQGQILSVLDATIQRLNVQPPSEQMGPSPVTFDDMLGEADASAAILPAPANGAIRSMAENRLILLLRDCLSGTTVMTSKAQTLFAQMFSKLLKAAAKRTSVFDHNACFVLCDFLEEAFAILTRYHQASEAATIFSDWPFWVDVCKRMLQSHNSMTQVRLFAFLYSMWPTLTSDLVMKREVTLHWLLTEEIFQTLFNHWCPMVRAFFMRLLAWRISRVDISPSELDSSILEILVRRLQQSWSYFLFLQETAGYPIMAAPSTPASGRRLLIMRNDVQPAPAGMFLSFDGILSSSSTTKVNPYERHSSLESLSRSSPGQNNKGAQDHDSAPGRSKKKWSLFRNIMPISSMPGHRPNTGLPFRAPGSSDGSRLNYEAMAKTKSSGFKRPLDRVAGTAPTYRSLSFKFSLEWIDRDGNSFGIEKSLYPPKLPLLAEMALESCEALEIDSSPLEPRGTALGPSKYAGRALAEWAFLVIECKNFFERRRVEGVPSYHMVETPTLGVEPFRKI